MPHAFAEIAFTPNVRAAQTRNGSREANHDLEQASDVGSVLTAREAEFIAARDSFYQATGSETGWANRRRLKILGRVRVVEEPDNPELVARLEVPAYRARVERGLVIRVEAYDWNCPQHITPRYSEAEISHLLEPPAEENRKLKAQLAAAGSAPPAILC